MWKTFDCSHQGRGHLKDNIPCQDKTCCTTCGEVTAITLADGAGSARYSHYGAGAVSKAIAYELCNHFDEYWNESNAHAAKSRLFQVINGELNMVSLTLSCDKKDLASTLLAVAVNGNRFIAIHVGDGVIGYMEHETLKVASTPTNGEFCNTTFFTTSSEGEAQTKLIKTQSDTIQAFLLMSDGSEACLYNYREKTLAKGLLRMIKDAATLPSSIVNDNIYETMHETIIRKTFDDCSLALLVKKCLGLKKVDPIRML